jgi:hypothetical protein
MMVGVLYVPLSFELIHQGWTAFLAIADVMRKWECEEIEYVGHEVHYDATIRTGFRVLK